MTPTRTLPRSKYCALALNSLSLFFLLAALAPGPSLLFFGISCALASSRLVVGEVATMAGMSAVEIMLVPRPSQGPFFAWFGAVVWVAVVLGLSAEAWYMRRLLEARIKW
jgi:hypothetical protein